jgi:protein-tyrosine phosphatase
VIDLHCHVLPGIDDGPTTIESSLALARAAVAAGTRTLVATPHVSWRYPNSAQDIAQLVAELNERLLAEEVALEVRAGAEIALTRAADISPQELGGLGLGGGPWLLVEPPFSPVVSGLDAQLLALQGQGHRIVLAHPERCPAFHRDPEMLAGLVDQGIITSITAGSLVGQFGERARRFALSLAQQGMMHNVASDAHDETQRPPSVSDELERCGLSPLAEWLTCAVPAAILEGRDAIPPRPSVSLENVGSAPRSWWHLRG